MKVVIGKPTGSSSYIIKKRINKIAKYVKLNNKRILDLGCGDGFYTIELAKRAKFVNGIDIEKKRLEKAKQMIKREKINNIKIELVEIENNKYPGNYFDVILLNEVLEHFQNEEKALKEIFRILKSSGKLVIYAPNRLFPIEGHGLHVGKFKSDCPIPFLPWLPRCISRHFLRARTYSRKSITKVLNQQNFEVTDVDYLFPPLDKIGSNKLIITLRNFLSNLESTPFKIFGMSILVICKKK